MQKAIEDLAKKYKLSKIEKRRLNSEYELTKLKVEFAAFKAKQKKISFYKSLVKYAGIERFLQKFPKKSYQKLAKDLKKIKEVDEDVIKKVALDLFNKSDYKKVNLRF